MKTRIIALLSLVAAASVAAPMSVSVTAAAQSTALGYTSNQLYTFTWVINDQYTGSANDFFDVNQNIWSDKSLFTTFSGDGLAGTYIQSNSVAIMRANAGGFELQAYRDPGMGFPSLGLTVNGNDAGVITVSYLDIGTINYADTAFVNPVTWLDSYKGTVAQSTASMSIQDKDFNQITFLPTSVTVAAIPEPATALLFGIGAMGAWMVRRNKIKSKEQADA
jgi:hypothetical protein